MARTRLARRLLFLMVIPSVLALISSGSSDMHGWTPLSVESSAHHSVTITLALKLDGVEWLKRDLEAYSTPGHARYGESRWTTVQVRQRVAPPTAAVRIVSHWLTIVNASITAVTPNNGFICATLPSVAAAEQAFDLASGSLRLWAHGDDRDARALRVLPGVRVALPRAIASALDFISGIERLPSLHRAHRHVIAATAPPSWNTTPSLLRMLYALPSPTRSIPSAAAAKNTLAIAAFNNESFLPSDLTLFQGYQGLPSQRACHLLLV